MSMVSGSDALKTIRQGQTAEMAIIQRCSEEIQAVSVDDTLTPVQKQTQIRQLQRMRNRANQALRELEDDERGIVENSQYAKEAVDALKSAAKSLQSEVKKTKRMVERTTDVAGIIDGVADAAEAVVNRVG